MRRSPAHRPSPSPGGELLDLLRSECARISEHARHVQLERTAIARYAASLPAPRPLRLPPEPVEPAARDAAAAYWVTLDAINFGSGWFPTLRKPPGRSGYRTIAEALRRRFECEGPWSAAQLRAITAGELSDVFGQDPGHPLMSLFAASLSDLGEHLEAECGASFLTLVDGAGGSAAALVGRLAVWDCFADVSLHEGRPVPFLKRAQIAAADLARAGVARFEDLERLTMFADNLVPHVLRLDGILRFSPELVARIEAGELIDHGSPEEIEIRACAVHAVELLVAAVPHRTSAADLDELLWQRGQRARYKASPRHRSRCSAY
jgi:hypothetical protein